MAMTEFRYKARKEKTLFIDLPNSKGLKIKGILRGELKNPLVVLLHGRPGSGNDLLEYLGARYLSEHGFNSLRLSFYDFELNTRNLLDCTLKTHADDFDTVINYLRKNKVTKIFAVGHSYGGATILKAKSKLVGAVLWDPSHGLTWKKHKTPKLEKMYPEKLVGSIKIGLAGKGYINSKAMFEDEKNWGDTTNWAKGKGYPLKLIAAPKGILKDLGKKYINIADKPKEYIEIPGASHSFHDSDKVMLQLFDETLKWFNRFVK